MTISSTIRVAGPFVGDDAVINLDFTFKVFDDTEVQILSRLDSTGVDTELVLGADYTVALNADQDNVPGGRVTLTSALATGRTAFIVSQVSPLQEAVFTNTGGFYPSVLNDSLDRLHALYLENREVVARAVVTPVGETGNLALPPVVNRAGMFLYFDLNGDIVAAEGTADGPLRVELYSTAAGEGDELITFVQTGTNPAARTVDDELKRWVSVDQFTGCDKTGATASTTAFRNAASAAGTGVVIVPPGSYLLDNSVSYPCTFWFMPGASIIDGTGGYITGAIVDLADRDYEALMGMGSFNIWLEGTSFSSPANNTFVASLWRAQYDGTSGTFSVDQAGGPLSVGAFNGIRWNQTVAGVGSTYRQLEYRVEDATTYNNGKATLSFIASCEAGTVDIAVAVRQFFGSGGSPSADVVVDTQSFTVTTTPQRFVVTVDMPSTSSKTFGSNFDDCLKLSIGFPATGTFNVAIQQFRFERGPIRSVFQAMPLALQYTHLDRYLQFVPLSIVGHASGAGEQTHTPIPFKSEMRRAPTITVDGATLGGSITNVTGGVQTNYNQRYGAMAYIVSTGAGSYSAAGQLVKLDARI